MALQRISRSHPNIIKMSKRKVWASEEDSAIRTLVAEFGIKQWTTVAREIETRYGLPGRTGKQCRERWHNHLDPDINKSRWTKAEDRLIFELQKLHGNRWAEIARQLPGRTDNSIKNRYYSAIRKYQRNLATSPRSESSDSEDTCDVVSLPRKRAVEVNESVAQLLYDVYSDCASGDVCDTE
jgi:myb proto-oncogene protein